MRSTLGKEEKLKSRKQIGLLFTEGKKVNSFPIHLTFLKTNFEAEFPIKVAFSVPKRNIKLAVNRNRIKRIMREVYRKNKHLFSDSISEKYNFMFIYMAKEELPYSVIEEALKKVSVKFLKQLQDD